MKNLRFNTLSLLACFLLILAGCDSSEPDPGPGEEELITRVTLTLTPSNGGADVVVNANDPDGDGANFEIGTINLTAGVSYTGSITVADDINNEDITEEVEAEADEHQFFYIPAGGVASRVTVTVTDMDGNGLPLGLAYTVDVSAGDAATGTMQVVLSHYDEGPKDGVNQSDESDVDLAFPVNIAAQ